VEVSVFFFSSRRRHTRSKRDWSSDVCSSDLFSSGDFQALLLQKFPEREGMVFLENQVAEYDKKRILIKDFIQTNLFVTDESSARSEERRVGKEGKARVTGDELKGNIRTKSRQ